jgi:hypothetical protein
MAGGSSTTSSTFADGRDTRARARRYGRDIVTRKESMGYRNLTLRGDDRATVRAAGLDPDYAH